MSKYIPGNQKHLSLEDRKYIERSLNSGCSFKDIARFLCKDPTTISKEVKLHRVSDWYHKGITSAFTDTTAEKLMHAEKSYSATLNVLPALPVTRLALISSKNGATVSIKLLMSVTDVLKPLITVPLPTSTVTMLSLQTVSTRNVCLRPGLV